MSELHDHTNNIPLGHITVPIMNVMVIGAWIIGTTISIVWQYYNVQSALTSINTEVKILSDKLGERISNIERDSDIKTATQWTRRDQEYWCSKTEQQNQSWKCGSFPEVSPQMPYWKSGKLEGQKN